MLTAANSTPRGYLNFTLHAHLPYVVNHGTWPHGLEWLHEAAAETYLPLLRILRNLERDSLALKCSLNISPVLLEQLAHPVFRAEFPRYLERKILAAREDEAYFTQAGEAHFAQTARYWQRFFQLASDEFAALDSDLISGFRHFQDTGQIELLTCCATHGYLPLLGTDESLRAQIRTAVDIHTRHLGRAPRGIWLPECGYRPAGPWEYPVTPAGSSEPLPAFDRIGVEQALAESSLEYFFVDTHLIEDSRPVLSPYGPGTRSGDAPHPNSRSLYHAYTVEGPGGVPTSVSVLARDPRTGVQVWSGDNGYPAEPLYLDFHKKRWPGGHRYWQVTGSKLDMADKTPYFPEEAAARARDHARHFVGLVHDTLRPAMHGPIPPLLTSPFDAELFGHWWYEGVLWLEEVARAMADADLPLALTTTSEYLDRFPRAGSLAMHEGSWGAEGTNQVWMNPDTSWTYTHIYPAEILVREIASGSQWRDDALGGRILRQLCRELLLLESSDWQFLITTGAARDYAETRFLTHNDQFQELAAIWQSFAASGSLSDHEHERLAAIEQRDNLFPGIDPSFWAAGAHATPDK